MILECPSCRARYLVQIGLFAQGGRQVRCVRCKHQWHARLPTNIDVFLPPPTPPMPPMPEIPAAVGATPVPETPNLPAVIDQGYLAFWRKLNPKIKRALYRAVQIIIVLTLASLWPIIDREKIVKVIPSLRATYQGFGFSFAHSGQGLEFDKVKSEIKYDGGTMRLFVDGVIRNTTAEMQFVPNIKARALGPDGDTIQSWWVASPSPTLAAGDEIPFHTEVNTPMSRTIENLYLEFYAQGDKDDVAP